MSDLIEVIELIDLIEVIEMIELIEDNKVYIYLYTAVKPPAERSEAIKYISTYTRRRSRRPSEARLIIKFISTYTRRRSRRPSEARLIKSIYLLIHGGEAAGRAKRG